MGRPTVHASRDHPPGSASRLGLDVNTMAAWRILMTTNLPGGMGLHESEGQVETANEWSGEGYRYMETTNG